MGLFEGAPAGPFLLFLGPDPFLGPCNYGLLGSMLDFQIRRHTPPRIWDPPPPVREVFGQSANLCGQSLSFDACFFILCLIVEICAHFLAFMPLFHQQPPRSGTPGGFFVPFYILCLIVEICAHFLSLCPLFVTCTPTFQKLPK